MTNFGFGAYNSINPAKITTPASTPAKPAQDENPVAKGVAEFKQAVQQAEQAAIDTAVDAQNHTLAHAIQGRLALYESGRAFVGPPIDPG